MLMIVGRPRGRRSRMPGSVSGSPERWSRISGSCCTGWRRATTGWPSVSRDDARLESFRLGGEVIHALAKDPLLPEELVETGVRAELWRAMLDYDARGKAIWASSEGEKPGTMPVPQLATSSTAG
ncbi:MAG: hypothetical protein U5R48_09525 [Gammaproteobacteria bacterium]|nr:hypothetical protein [Gammaproteobacteria bacterium]